MLRYSNDDVLSVLFNMEVKAWHEEQYGRKRENDQDIYDNKQGFFSSNEELERIVLTYCEHEYFLSPWSSDRLRAQLNAEESDEQIRRQRFSEEIERCRRGEDILRECTLVHVEASSQESEAFAHSYGERRASSVVKDSRLGEPHYWMLIDKSKEPITSNSIEKTDEGLV